MRKLFCTALLLGTAPLLSVGVRAQSHLPAPARIDAIVRTVLKETGAPSASIAVVADGHVAYVKAYGNAHLARLAPAREEMRYAIGSISKQFLACAVLLLTEEGKLSLDDPVSRFLPDLTRASEVTIRQLLSHTSGYQDYYPLDYVAPFMTHPVTPEGILQGWAKKPLDFAPGTQWQYSNTNYVLAGRIIEQVAGMPLMSFLQSRILGPLGMRSAIDLAQQSLSSNDASGYTRFGLAAVRPAPLEGRGWLFAAGELAMTARDLALWDQSLMERKVLKPASFNEMIRPARLKNGAPTNYGLGVGISNADGHPKLEHGGAISGFVSDNAVWLDQRVAVVALTNLDGTSAASSIANQIGSLLISEQQDQQAAPELERARRVFSTLQQGRIDRALLTSDADAFFTPQVLADASASLQPLGSPEKFEQVAFGPRGGMIYRRFRIRFASGKILSLTTFSTADGKLAQYLIQ